MTLNQTLELNLSYMNLISFNEIKLDINLNTNLQHLNLGGNKIKEINDFSSLTNLQVLILYGNQIKNIRELSSLTNLQSLYLAWNKIKEIKGLSSLINLQKLDLRHNEIKEIVELSNLTNLQMLDLYNNQIPYYEKKQDRLIRRNREITWKMVKPQFIRYCFTLAPLNLPVDILIMIFDINSYPNHLYQKWKIGKTIKDAYQLKMIFMYRKIE
jgi:hypothetical protein